MKKFLLYGFAAIVVVLGGLFVIGTMAKKEADRPVTEEENDALRDQIDANLEAINAKLADIKTAIILCEYFECRETVEGRHVYQTKNGEFWFYSDGEVADISQLEFKEE